MGAKASWAPGWGRAWVTREAAKQRAEEAPRARRSKRGQRGRR